MFTVYIIKSIKTGKYYIGSTSNLDERLKRHNSSRNKSTRNGVPWKIVYNESFFGKNDAYRLKLVPWVQIPLPPLFYNC